ncbi:MAG: cellulase family glycosylhydrolase [Chloroflexota bacterium]
MSSLNMTLPPNVVEVIKSKWMERIVDFVLVPALLFYSLWLPPVSIGNRLFHLDYPQISEEGGILNELNGARLSIPAGALGESMRAQISSLSVATLLAGNGEKHLSAAVDALPPDVILRDRIYEFDTHGDIPSESVFSVPLPEDAEIVTALDLYAWDGNTWQWVPSHVHATSGRIKAELGTIPAMLAVVESPALEPFITAEIPAEGAFPELPQELFTSVLLQGLYVQGDGTISGDLNGADTAMSYGELDVYPRISNIIDGVVRSDFVDNIIINAELTTGHISEIVDVVKRGGYPGVQMDYRGVDPDLRHEFSDFIAGLADALHSEGKLLSVMVELPTMISEYGYNSGAYDWGAIGKTADFVVLPIATTIEACASGGDMEDLLGWAVGEVHRDKLHLAISAMSYQEQEGETIACTYGDVLAELGEVAIAEGSQMLIPGESLTLELPKLKDAGGLNYDAETATYWYVRQDAEGREQKIYLTNAASVAYRLLWIDQFRLGGVVLADVCCPDSDPRIWDAVRDFRNQTSSVAQNDLSLVWTISTDEGDPVGSQIVPLDAAEGTSLVWTAPNNPGNYIISLSISDDGGETTRVQGGSVEVEVPTATPSPTPTSTPTATPTPTLVPTATPKPKPVVVAMSAMPGTGFGYGIQPDMVTDGDHGRIVSHVHQLGFGWIKQQVEWFRYNPGPGQYDWGTLDRIVDACTNNGINVMFSVVKAPHWARPPGDTDEGPPADPNTYGEFLKAMAARYKGRVKAYEIWNEQNLYYEWGGRGGKLNAGKYVELLKVAYGAIKSVDPGAIVISGALTPTGYNDGDTAIDDRVYLEQMYQAGLARYCDAVGAHPSGYNNPPDADWRSYSDPSKTFNPPPHPSWFFRGTMESYRNIMVKYGDGHKRIWVTEFGWATVEGLGVPPAEGYGYAADNTEAEQAQWLVRAYEMGKNWGWVGVMFLWNLNFAPVSGKENEKAAFGIVRDNWSPRPAFAALAHMPK